MTSAMKVSEERLEQIYDDLQDAGCICEMNAVLSALTKDDLEATYGDFMVQYGQELALGALERSEWVCGTLIINANQASLCFVGTALDAMRDEMEQRKAAVVGGQAEAGVANRQTLSADNPAYSTAGMQDQSQTPVLLPGVPRKGLLPKAKQLKKTENTRYQSL